MCGSPPLSYENRFKRLTALLNREEQLWRERPFVQLPVSWEADRPALSAALRGLSPEAVDAFESQPTTAPCVRAAVPELIRELEGVCHWPALSAAEAFSRGAAPKRVARRKWQQVVSFVETVAARVPDGVHRWVDWCSGKGGLGRMLAATFEQSVTCIEKRSSLCDTGRREADLAGLPLSFNCLDVLEDGAGDLLDADTGVAALHACGHLNTALVRQGIARGVPFMAIAPCCYQRIDGMRYHPLSEVACRYDVPLTRHQLRLPSLNETMTTDRKRAMRRREHAFRLGVDLLQRQQSGKDEYRALGPVKPGWLKHDFAHFATRIATARDIVLPDRIDWDAAEQRGWERFHTVSALGLARGLFRRAIESWLVLDRALFLEANGYSVRIGTFCDEILTPRNLVIIATRRGGAPPQ